MTVSGLLVPLLRDPALGGAVARARDHDGGGQGLSAPSAVRPFTMAALAAEAGRSVLAVTATSREAEDLAAALRSLLDPAHVAEYPAWETLPHERLSPRADTVGRRLAVLRRLRHPSTTDPATGPIKVLVAPIRSVLQPQVPDLGDLEPVSLKPGDDADPDDIVRRLVDVAYARVDLVEKRGEFAVRGGIIDVFPPTEEHPLRVEFWGDTVEEVRWFKVADQRSLEVAPQGLWAPPVPGAAAHPGGASAGEGAGPGASGYRGHARQDGRRHPGRGHGGPRPSLGRPDDAPHRRAPEERARRRQ